MAQKLLRDDIEYIVHCDSTGKIIGPISKEHAHLDGVRERLSHYSTWSMIYHPSSGNYGLQRKNPDKHDKYSGGKWDMGAAGHNCYVKDGGSWRPLGFEENLAKEAQEEIGLDLTVHHSKEEFLAALSQHPKKAHGFIFEKFHFKTGHNNEWVGLAFIIVPDKETDFIDNEVIDFKWLSPDKLKEFLKNEEGNYCSPLPLVFEKAEKFRKEYNL